MPRSTLTMTMLTSMSTRKPIVLERKPIPDLFNSFVVSLLRKEWYAFKRYDTAKAAIQGYEQMVKSGFNRKFEYRLQTPVGTVSLPVVKA